MRRLAFRRLLPMVQLVLFLFLLPLSQEQERQHYKAQRGPLPTSEATADEVAVATWELSTLHGRYEPWALIVAHALNAPVFLFLEIVAEALNVHPNGEKWWQFYLGGGIGVLLLWYCVGRVIDRRLDLDGVKPEIAPSLARRILVWLSCVMLGFLALFALLLYMDGYSSTLSLDLWLVLWFGFGAIGQWRKLARWRAARHPTTLHLQPNR